ncbi:MAG TPA: cellobiose phosphorylase, partial [Clostridiales bacterium UBA8960]|nr:cellobiose phosphorylase [Clostridiales bacterium UBA8960]
MKPYTYEDSRFIINDYDEQKPFASFLPGVAGLDGIPMWVYYTNRGQGIACFGTENKDGAILDFVPANVAYRRTELQGFRTFIRIDGITSEIFSSVSTDDYNRRMVILPNGVGFEETNLTLGIKVSVNYFTTTHKPYAGLVRKVVLTNLDGEPKQIELLDGLMTVWPYKNDNFAIKNMSNLAVAWFEVFNHENNIPFYRNRSTTSDSAAVGSVEAGHFYAAYEGSSAKALPILYDPDVIFGNHTGLIKPRNFEKHPLSKLLEMDSVSANKLPCAFAAYEGVLGSELILTSIAGKMSHLDQLNAISKAFCTEYFLKIEQAANTLGEALTQDVKSKTAYPIFDAYVRQTYLDNLLRGGYPILFEGKDKPIVYHVYSRIHGDMEREYNDFYVEPAFYSHGNGNFRDVNQNRRNDVYFVKEAGQFNIKQFMDLLQMDGQNPLVIKGSTFTISDEDRDWVLTHVQDQKEIIASVLDKNFTPGALMRHIIEQRISLTVSSEDFVKLVLSRSEQHNDAAYGHGFWVDHWTYNMDLVDNYLNVFPDQLESLIFEGAYKYFQSPDVVLPR